MPKLFISAARIAVIFCLDDKVELQTWLRDRCHSDRRGNSYHTAVLFKLVEKGYTIVPNMVKGNYPMRYRDNDYDVMLNGTLAGMNKENKWTHISVFMRHNGYTALTPYEFMFDEAGVKCVAYGYKQTPERGIEVWTSRGLMFANQQGVLKELPW